MLAELAWHGPAGTARRSVAFRYLGEAAEAQGILPAGRAGVLVQDGGVGRHGVVDQGAVHTAHRHLRAHVAQDVGAAAQVTAEESVRRAEGMGTVSNGNGGEMD